jgi:hypothetical protein
MNGSEAPAREVGSDSLNVPTHRISEDAISNAVEKAR